MVIFHSFLYVYQRVNFSDPIVTSLGSLVRIREIIPNIPISHSFRLASYYRVIIICPYIYNIYMYVYIYMYIYIYMTYTMYIIDWGLR